MTFQTSFEGFKIVDLYKKDVNKEVKKDYFPVILSNHFIGNRLFRRGHKGNKKIICNKIANVREIFDIIEAEIRKA